MQVENKELLNWLATLYVTQLSKHQSLHILHFPLVWATLPSCVGFLFPLVWALLGPTPLGWCKKM